MSTFAYVNAYTHSVTFATDKLLMSLKDILVRSGLSPEKLTETAHYRTLRLGIYTWLNHQQLERVILEVYSQQDPTKLIGRWDFDIFYGSSGEGGLWVDTDEIRYAIQKAGTYPSLCTYDVIVHRKPGAVVVDGWTSCTLRSTSGFVRQSIGNTIDASGAIRTSAAYWRRP